MSFILRKISQTLPRRSLLKPSSAFFTTSSSSSSTNAEEISKFDKLKSSWWDVNSPSGAGPLHFMNPVRVNFIRESVARELQRDHLFYSKQFQGLQILDVGCGGGLLSESLSRLGGRVMGIDPSPNNINICNSHKLKDPLTKDIVYKQNTIEELSQNSENHQKFDVITCLEVIEHIEDNNGNSKNNNNGIEHIEEFIKNIIKCLKPGGQIFFSTINKNFKAYLLTIFAAEKILGIVPNGTHDWNKYIRPEDFINILNLKSIDLSVKDTKGIVLDVDNIFLTGINKWKLSDKDIDVNYIIHAVKK